MLFTLHAGLRVRSVHPAFPAPSLFLGRTIDAKLGRIVSREGGVVSTVIPGCATWRRPGISRFSGAQARTVVRCSASPRMTEDGSSLRSVRNDGQGREHLSPVQPLDEIASPIIQRRQPIGFRDVLNRVGIEEGIERRGRPGHGGEAIACRPAVDPSDVFDHQRVAQLVA